MAWFVTGITDPKLTTGTVSPYIFQAASAAAATKQIGGPPFAGPFATKAQAQAWVNSHGSEFGPGKTGAAPLAPNLATPASSLPKIPNPLSGLQAIGKFFAALGQASTWIRVAEALLGLGLIAVGLAKITNTDTKLKKAALSAAKVAAL